MDAATKSSSSRAPICSGRYTGAGEDSHRKSASRNPVQIVTVYRGEPAGDPRRVRCRGAWSPTGWFLQRLTSLV